MKLFFSFVFVLSAGFAIGQNVGIGTNSPNGSATLDVSATNRGMLMPRMTTNQRKAIASPALGLLVFDTDKATVMFFDGSKWKAMVFADEDVTSPISRNSTEPQQNAAFGRRAAISGNYAIIGAPLFSSGGISSMGAAYIFTKSASGWQQQARLVAKDSSANDLFGSSVAIAGDFAIVAAPNKKIGNNLGQGKVYLFKRNGSNWERDSSFTKAAGIAYDNFGWSVSISPDATGGPAMAIGIPFSDAAGTDKGEVFMFKRNNGNNKWSLQQTLVPSDLSGSDYFGYCVSLDSDYVAIGAPNQSQTAPTVTNGGAAYIYVFSGGSWSFQKKFAGSYNAGQFGTSISLFSNKLAISAPAAAAYSNTSSTVYLYKRSLTTWNNIAGIFLYDYEGGTSNITFGMSISLNGKDLLIGAPGGIELPNGNSTISPNISGAVYVYRNYTNDLFTKTQVLKSDNPVNTDLFGESIGISNGNYIISNSRTNVNGLINAGNILLGYIAN